MKIIEKLWRVQDAAKQCLSFEYYPPKEKKRWPAFFEKVKRMSRLEPEFIDVTWGTGDPTSLDSLEVSQMIQRLTKIDTMMHLTCTHRSKDELYKILKVVRDSEMDNIMALRGNRPDNRAWEAPANGFSSAAELVDFIRDAFKGHFCISVAAYPEGHRDCGTAADPNYYATDAYRRELEYLKQKVDAGADFVVTQLCFDMERLRQFGEDCRDVGINVPIVAGILPIHSLAVYRKIASFSASIPQQIQEEVAALKQDQIEDYAVDLLLRQLEELRGYGFFAVHLYTLNFEKIIKRTVALRGRYT
ncbi:MAG: methylenetetrahydrofolate reductase [Bradymonadales bacterium]|jgi:methylenetetrahydrofolate reductase (NADPH)